MNRLSLAGGLLAALLLFGACSATSAPDRQASAPVSEQSGSAEPATDTEPELDAAPAADTEETSELDPAETFLAWLEASRIPDVEVACGYMTDDLIDKMIAEFEADYGMDPGGCEGLTELTADLYRTFNQSSEVSIRVVSEDQAEAVIFVTYLENGDCVRVVLEKDAGGWIMNDQTDGCRQG